MVTMVDAAAAPSASTTRRLGWAASATGFSPWNSLMTQSQYSRCLS
jgi:hypothetical protein